jgi:hypothetical protein
MVFLGLNNPIPVKGDKIALVSLKPSPTVNPKVTFKPTVQYPPLYATSEAAKF